MNAMERVLKRVNLEMHLDRFKEEKITPDVVNKLSKNDFRTLGIINSSDIMKIRMECIVFSRETNQGPFMTAEVSKHTLETLLEAGFTVHDMAKLLSVSERTLFRRFCQYNFQVRSFTEIDDRTLDALLHEVIPEFPRSGETMLRQILCAKGIKVQRSRLRERLHVIDKAGLEERRRRRLHRRVYEVSAPNCVWHIDTNHKLIRWKFVVAGGVDGFSRYIVYMKCVDNNKAITIFNCFVEAVHRYGQPLTVRSDKGMENIEVARYMLQNRRTMITGTSTHNQRVERMWRDVYQGVLGYFYDLFYLMEDEGVLNPLNEVHIFALHYIFLPMINHKLAIWNDAWANHRLRTVRSSPKRLFIAGAINTNADVQDDPTSSPAAVETDDVETLAGDNVRPILENPNFEVSSFCKQELEQNCVINVSNSISGINAFMNAVEIILKHHG